MLRAMGLIQRLQMQPVTSVLQSGRIPGSVMWMYLKWFARALDAPGSRNAA